jgi:radical SAM protein with 4Fe4S-binding SPASM domain
MKWMELVRDRRIRTLWWDAFKQHWFSFEHDYFSLNDTLDRMKYFLRREHLLRHLKDRLYFRIYPKVKLVAPFPTHVEIEAASACQMRCPMCYTTVMDNRLKGVMKWELFTKIVDECAARGVYSIKLSWRGEPLLNRRIVDMVAYAKQKGIVDVAFLTNGERLTPEIADALIDAGLDWISFSFDGFKETYDVIRKPATFEETVDRIKMLRGKRDSRGLKKPLIRVQSIFSVIQHDPMGFRKIFDGIADSVNFIADQIRDFEEGKIQHNPFYQCPIPWQRMAVAHNGKVHQCISDYAGQNILGDVTQKSLYQIWHDKPFRELRKSFLTFRYLENAACRICTDGAVTEKVQVKLGDRSVPVTVYKDIKANLTTPARTAPASPAESL